MFSAIANFYHEADSVADPIVKEWFLMNSAWLPVSITSFYLYFVLVLGPRLMKNRKAFDINRVIIIYNVAQVIFNGYLFYQSFGFFWQNLYSFRCFKCPSGDTPEGYLQREVNWLFMLNKLMDLLDTVFFVVKKKQSHVSFLHVYHHVITFTTCWLVAKYLPGGQIIFIGVLNSFVHTVMYSYYLFSLLNQFKQLSAFVKKHITQMQIIQFILAVIHAAYGATDPTCDYPISLVIFGISQGVVLTILFLNFYSQAYLKSRKMDHTPQNGYVKNGIVKKTL